MLKKQSPNYIDSNISEVFHFLELRGSHNILIGSKTIRNLLYSNDYDLNANIKMSDSHVILHQVYNEFLNIFNTAYKSPYYYIFDFKNGMYNDEPIRWMYDDIKRGEIKCGGRMVTFEECLLMDNNKIKLDICYLYNGIFTDINCLYILHFVKDKSDYEKTKADQKKETIKTMKKEITELEKTGEYYKSLKRYFSLGLVENKFNKSILNIMNSDYGIFYKFITFLNLTVEMIEQTFKPIQLPLIRSNLEFIKEFTSHITSFNTDTYLDELIVVIKSKSKNIMIQKLEKLVEKASKYLDNTVSNLI